MKKTSMYLIVAGFSLVFAFSVCAKTPAQTKTRAGKVKSQNSVWVERGFSGGVACRSFRPREESRIRFQTGDLFREKLKPLRQIKKALPKCNNSCGCPTYNFMLYLLLPRERLEDAEKLDFKIRKNQARPIGKVLK